MSRNSRCALVCAVALLSVAAFANTSEWTPVRSFRTFSKANWRGLPQSSVMALAQDADGVLWIGTLDGVASFDGRTITPVPDVPAAPLRGIIAGIVARKKGGVYVGSSAGVHIFDGRAWRLVPTHRGVVALAEARDGTLWMAETDGALSTLTSQDTWQRHTELTEPAVALAAAPDGAVWAATNAGAVRLIAGRSEAVNGPPLPGRPGALIVAHDGRAWTATGAGTVHWTSGGADGWHQAVFAPWPRNAFRCLAEDRRGRIWAGSYGGGVAFGNAAMPWTVWNAVNGPFEAGVMSVLADREGSVWFGLNAVGLAQWVGEEWSHRTRIDPLNPTPRLFSAFGLSRGPEPGSLYVAAFNAGALRLDKTAMRQFGAPEGLTEDVRQLVEAEPGTLIAGTRFGIFESRGGGQPFKQVLKLPAGFVMGLFRSPDGHWYAATSTQGALIREGDAWKPAEALNASLDNMHVRGMTWMRNRELWVATLRGVTIFRDGKPAEHLTSTINTAIPGSVNAVLQVSADEIWVGGTGGIAIRRAGKWKRITEADGMPGQTAYSLGLAPDGAIWVGGSGGVGRYAAGRWTVWDSRQGLLQEECNLNGLVVEDDCSVYVGTMGGLAHFDPTVKPLAPPSVKLDWVATPPRDAAGLAHLDTRSRSLHLRWSAAWLGPQPVQYRVRVPRLRESWSEPMSDDHLDVENVGAGLWQAQVEARVEGTTAWSKPITLDIDVAPFWYETLVARIGMLALLIALIYAAVRLRLRALRHHAAMLEATVEERTAQLAEKVELLHESEQRALAASRAKSAFLANMSHELRTPLNGVLGFAQLLSRRKNRDAEDQEGLAVIMKSGEHLLGLINDVLSLSKIEAGRVTLDESPFDLAKLVRDVEAVLRFRAEEHELRFETKIDESIPAVVIGDQGRLRQILINLVGNAVKFTQSGSVTVRAKWSEGRAVIDVEDTGPGIAADELPRLFEPFAQTDSGRANKEGTGLGLALSRDLARLMGGDIEVESTLGGGSLFRVTANLREASTDTIVPARDGRQQVARLAPGQAAPRILVVDDIAVNRTVLSRLLLSVGFEVRESASGEEALAVWQTWEPHLIWMDKWMHGLDGLEVTRRIRAYEEATGRPHVPIIALSASALEQERGEILAAGCDDFVAKPFRASTIFNTLAEYLGVRYEYDDVEAPAATVPRAEEAPVPNAPAVLLVDDDWICRQVAQQLLRENGVAVTSVASGREALAAVARDSFDLVLMDMHMPGMDGREAARHIKAAAGSRMLPIIAMTAESFDTLADAGMDDYIAKPIEPEAITALLGRWLPIRKDQSSRA
jgi:signal transduction histidine kinase/CheY-like chemotaxis protein/ligand-binding sensor domain-containing protein